MSDLPEGWAESAITIRYPVEELEAARAYYAIYSRHLDPDAHTSFTYKFDARLRAAALDQIPAPKRQPRAGEVWRFSTQGPTRPVRAVDGTYVYLGPGSDGGDPVVWILDNFLTVFEFGSEGGDDE